jgi:choline dehydrogenase-like flavoprotein
VLVDARNLGPGDRLKADICIVGSGAAGISLARELSRGTHSVLLLECGGLEFESGAQSLAQGDNVGLPYFPLDAVRLRYFGGTTNHWNGACWPLDPIDFEQRPGIPNSGWPIDLRDLEPFYRRAHEVCQLGPWEYDPQVWAERTGRRVLEYDAALVRTKIIQSSPPTRFGTTYRQELLDAPNVTVCLHATALELESDAAGGRVVRLRAASAPDRELHVHADRYVLATGALENARLLLVSRRGGEAGLGNRHDVVGRYFMEHPHTRIGTFVAEDDRRTLGLYRKTRVDGVTVRGSLATNPDWLREHRLLGVAAGFQRLQVGRFSELDEDRFPGIASLSALGRAVEERRLPEGLAGHLANVIADSGEIASRFVERWRTGDWPGYRSFVLECLSEQVPNPESRVRLGRRRDPFGLPRIELDWRLTELDQQSLRRATELFASEAGRLGIGRMRIDLEDGPTDAWARWDGSTPWRGPKGSYHLMGTTRMHEDAHRGVVDPDCRVHGVENLWIAGSSVFPTSGSVNPTLTIVALALRLADHLSAAR